MTHPALAFALLTAGAAAVAAQAGCGGHRGTADTGAAAPLAVTTGHATASTLSDTVDAGGLVTARGAATLVSRIVAPVTSVRVVPGARVRAGQVLVTLDDRDLAAHAGRAGAMGDAARQGERAAAAERDAAAAALRLAQATFERVTLLHERKSATDHELDQATAALRGAEAGAAAADARALEAASAVSGAVAAGTAAETTAGFAVIRAPFDGIITEQLVDPGNMAAPGTPLLRIESTDGYRLEIRVDGGRVRFIAPGDRLPVSLDLAADHDVPSGVVEVHGTVAEVARAIDADSRAALVKIDLPAIAGLTAGTFGRARLPGAPRAGLTVPADALVTRGQLRYVYVVEEDRARLRLVNAGRVIDGRAEILAGLSEGEAVVVDPPPGLPDNRPVRATPWAAPPASRTGGL
jgi:RND family efflux transporter MFP subunit